MAKKKNRVFSGKFVAGIIIYAIVFLALVGVGLSYFWKFIDAYELSRPKNTLEAYMEQLSIEQMCSGADELYASVDQNLQSREQFDQVIQDSLNGELNYAKKSSESTEERQVYVIRCGRTPIGQFAIAAGEEDSFGFRRWTVEDYSFDFAHLMGQSVSITVPSEYQVSVNGNVLDETYITATDLEYSALDGFYGDYELPHMVTYSVQNLLGEIVLTAADSSGNPVEITAETDMNTMLPQCTADEAAKVEAFAKTFVPLWVNFSGSTKDTSTYHYYNICKVLSSDGVLSAWLYTALDGLSYGQSSGATIKDITINRMVPLNDGMYMCDVTYLVSTIGKQGAVDTSSNMKLMIATENGELKLKSMERY